MNKLETPCIQCGADRVYTHLNSKTAKWTVYCDTCVGGYASEEEAVTAYMRVVRMVAGNDELTKTIAFRIKDLQENKMLREALEGMVEAYPIKDIGWLKACECPMCQSYKDGKAALVEVNDE